MSENAPWLALIIADVLDLQSDLLHDLTVDRLFKALPDFHETGDQRVSAVRVVVPRGTWTLKVCPRRRSQR